MEVTPSQIGGDERSRDSGQLLLVYTEVPVSLPALAGRSCTTLPLELQSNQPETQNTSRPGAVKIIAPGREKFLTTYSATVGGGPHGKTVGGEF